MSQAGSFGGSGTGKLILHYTNVAVTPYLALPTDAYLSVDTSANNPTIIRLPNTTTVGRTFFIKDRIGQAGTRNIVITTPGGLVTIDGGATFTMNTSFEAINVIFNGSNYEVW